MVAQVSPLATRRALLAGSAATAVLLLPGCQTLDTGGAFVELGVASNEIIGGRRYQHRRKSDKLGLGQFSWRPPIDR